MKYLSILIGTAFMVAVLGKNNEAVSNSQAKQFEIAGNYKPIKNSCAGTVIVFEPLIEADTIKDRIRISNLSYLPVGASVDLEEGTFDLDTFIYGYDEIAGRGSFSQDTLTLLLHHAPASFAPEGRNAFDCTTVLVKN
jgi:hypothetical protein